MRMRPKVGDIVEVRPFEQGRVMQGFVLRVRDHKDGSWSAAELLVNGRRRWYTRGSIERVIGRPRGISRIDQPTRRTHGWFVRLNYVGKTPQTVRMFSDLKHNGIDNALEAALAFRAANE